MTSHPPHRPVRQREVPLQRPWWINGPEWASHGLRQPGWLLLPLRAFLGVTFTFAALQKLANPDFFNASSPASVQHQMQSLAPTSPIGALVQLSLHAGFLVGLLIALGELAVGVGTLLGLKAKLAACGGAVLAFSFFLTVSWNTSPYYYGADIVFLFAWTPFIFIGAGGVLSTDAWIAGRGATRTVPARQARREPVRQRERRAIFMAGGASLLVAGLTALIGRMSSGSSQTAQSPTLGRSSSKTQRPAKSPKTRPPGTPNSAPSGMTRIGSTSALPVGQAGQFRDPANGNPAWLVRLGRNKYSAFSAVCTHAGCTVQYSAGNNAFICPCHGGTFSASTGEVLAGPPPAPLPPIAVQVANGEIYVT